VGGGDGDIGCDVGNGEVRQKNKYGQVVRRCELRKVRANKETNKDLSIRLPGNGNYLSDVEQPGENMSEDGEQWSE